MPKNPARFCVWDPKADCYVAGLINTTRQKAELAGAKVHPANWEEVAKANGWGPLPAAIEDDGQEPPQDDGQEPEPAVEETDSKPKNKKKKGI